MLVGHKKAHGWNNHGSNVNISHAMNEPVDCMSLKH